MPSLTAHRAFATVETERRPVATRSGRYEENSMRLDQGPFGCGWALLVVLAVVGACAPAAPAQRSGQGSAPDGSAAAPAAAAPAKVNLGLAFDTLGRAPLYVAM